MNCNSEIKSSVRQMCRKLIKKLGCRVKVAYQPGEDGRFCEIRIMIAYDSETASM